MGLAAAALVLLAASAAWGHLDRGEGLVLGWRLERGELIAAHRLPEPLVARVLDLPASGRERTQALREGMSRALSGPLGVSAGGERLEARITRLDLDAGTSDRAPGAEPAPTVEVVARYRVPYAAERLTFHWDWPEAFEAPAGTRTATGAHVHDAIRGTLEGPDGERVEVVFRRDDPRFTWRRPSRGVPAWSIILIALGALTLAATVLGRLRKSA
jgi:hypothetical protein